MAGGKKEISLQAKT